jgi:hypothetical protein
MRLLDSTLRRTVGKNLGHLGVSGAALVFAHASFAQDSLFTASEKGRLVELVAKDAGAKAEFAYIKEQADLAMGEAPNPIRTIRTEGKLAGDPDKVATQASLRDMRALSVLGYAYEITGDSKYADKARSFVLAWARVNEPTGDPIDETNLEPLIVAYDQTLETFSSAERKAADAYLRRIIDAEWGARQLTSNWQSHRLKIAGIAAYVLKDNALVARAIEGFKRQIGANLNGDGSSYDFQERDALHYHVYDLEPLLALAIAAHNNGLELYDYTGKAGGSLRKSVNFLIPYCTGEKTHQEFVHSQVEFDRKRAANGEKGYQIGHLFRPAEGFRALSLAAFFDESVDPVVAALARKYSDPLAEWTLVVCRAGRPG